jgi:hypothetical protein
MNITSLVEMKKTVCISDVKTDSVILECETTVEFLNAFRLIFRFSQHEEVVNVYRDEDSSIDRVEGAFVCLTYLEAEIQNQLAKDENRIRDACLRP